MRHAMKTLGLSMLLALATGAAVDQGLPNRDSNAWPVKLATGSTSSVVIVNSGHTDTTTTETSVALTAAAPTLVTDGADQTNAVAMRISVEAPAANTINAAGKLDAYEYVNSVWHRVPDLDLTPTTAGFQNYTFGDMTVVVPFGRISYRPNGLILTGGGTTVTVRYEVIT